MSSFGFIVEIADWTYDFSWAFRPDKRQSDKFFEAGAIVITGILRVPDKGFAKDVTIRLHPEKHLNEGEHYRRSEQARAVGHLDARGSTFDVILWFPESHLIPICTSLTARKQRYVWLTTDELVRKEAHVTWFSLRDAIDPELWEESAADWRPKPRAKSKGTVIKKAS